MKSRVINIIIALTLVIGVLPFSVSADGGPTIVTYRNAETMKPIPGLFRSANEQFEIEQPDGTSFIVGSHYFDEGFGGFYINLSESVTEMHTGTVTQAGKHIFTSYPVPDGYEVVEVYNNKEVFDPVSGKTDYEKEIGGFSIPENFIYGYTAEIYILLREIGSGSGQPQQSAAISGLAANPTAGAVLVNGEAIAFDAYNIDGNNYFKLRDLGFALLGTEKQFDVSWDAENDAILLIRDTSYTPVGGEMVTGNAHAKIAVVTSSKVIVDGEAVSLGAYNIDGNNYFKLRDIGVVFNFGVTWDGNQNMILIDTAVDYSEN